MRSTSSARFFAFVVFMLDIYVDESCQSGHRYLVIACVITSTSNVHPILEKLKEARQAANLHKELKWVKVSKGKLAGYKLIVDAVFDLIKPVGGTQSSMHFHSIVIDTSQINHAKFNGGSSEIGFNKFVYQLICKAGLRYKDQQPFYVYLDDRTTKHGLDELKKVLNNGFAKESGTTARPFHRLTFRDSHKADLIQIADLFAGAIGYTKNEHDKAENAGPAKKELAQYIAAKAGRSITNNTPFAQNWFRIWNLQLKK